MGALLPRSRKFISQVHGPGPAIAGAWWLSARGIFAAGSDTVAFEKVPDLAMPVHVHLLVKRAFISSNASIWKSSRRPAVREFLFIALPLKIEGATGSPVRPVAIVSK